MCSRASAEMSRNSASWAFMSSWNMRVTVRSPFFAERNAECRARPRGRAPGSLATAFSRRLDRFAEAAGGDGQVGG